TYRLLDAVMVRDTRHPSGAQGIGIRAQYEAAAGARECQRQISRDLPQRLVAANRRRSVSQFHLLALVSLPAIAMQELHLIRWKREVCCYGRKRQNDLSLDEQPNETLRLRAVRIGPKVVFRSPSTRSERVLEIVDSNLGGLSAGHRCEVSCHGESKAMSLVDDCRKSIPRDLLVNLKRRETFRCPVADGAAPILRVADDLLREKAAAFAVEERPGQMHFRSGHGSAVDAAVDIQVNVGMIGSGGSNRGHPKRQIQAR